MLQDSTIRLLFSFFALLLAAPVHAQESAANPVPPEIEDELKPRKALGARVMSDLSPEAQKVLRERLAASSQRPMSPVPKRTKKAMYDMMAAFSPLSMRDMFNFMTDKIKVEEGITFDEVLESMEIKANALNFKKVGHSEFWKDVAAIGGLPTTRVEVLHYCDALVGRRMLDYSAEFSVFIPCRITVYEDANGDLWVMTLDWDVSWLALAWHPGSQLDEQLKQDAIFIRDVMREIMQAGAAGAW
ncbi:MAG: DUF302 domain-containing protein [Pseudomonadota bacterium]|nr:DUF302 domain-containing protein [Pseudomonadota bacterium]